MAGSLLLTRVDSVAALRDQHARFNCLWRRGNLHGWSIRDSRVAPGAPRGARRSDDRASSGMTMPSTDTTDHTELLQPQTTQTPRIFLTTDNTDTTDLFNHGQHRHHG